MAVWDRKTNKYKIKRKVGRKPRWDSKAGMKRLKRQMESDRKMDDFRSVIRGTMSHDEYEKKHGIKEDVPTNAMGASSSAPGDGAIDTYDPVLDLGGGKVKNKMRKKLFDILRRKLLSDKR